MIHITAYRTVNGHRSDLIPHEATCNTIQELTSVKRELMKRTGKQVDLVYHTKPDEVQVKEPEPEQKIEVHVKYLSGVILRNSKLISNFINSLKP